jgi:hypothetical protein
MSESQTLLSRLTRRQWLTLSAGTLAGCGGGGQLLADGPPGTGGTGLFAEGAIAGFGSVILNGVRFTDSSASVTLDGAPASSADLRLGMVANVMGQHAGTGTGSAASIEVWTIAQGVVTAVAAGGSQFTVAGMNLAADSATVLEGMANLAQLSVGTHVAVWGLQGAADARAWDATRIAVTASPVTATTGYITQVGSARTLNGLLVSGAAADGAATGQLVRMQGTLSAGGDSLAVSSAQAQGTASNLSPQVDCVVSGLVTSSSGQGNGAYSSFMLGNYPVDASSASVSPAGASLTVGAQVQVTGNWQNGVLKLSSIALSSEQARRAVQVTATIDQFTSLADFVARGQHFDASAATLSGYTTLGDFKAGATVQLAGLISGNVVKVSSLALVK